MDKKEYLDKYGFEPLPFDNFKSRQESGFHRAAGRVFTSRGKDGSFIYTCPFCGKYGEKKGSAAGFVKAVYMRHAYECELRALEEFYKEKTNV